MKKIIVFALLLSLCLVGQAFAIDLLAAADAPGTPGDAGKSVWATAPADTLIGKTSKGVRMGARFETTAYALTTVHQSGSKYFGTAWDSTAIYTLAPPGDINASFDMPATSMNQTAFVDTNWGKL